MLVILKQAYAKIGRATENIQHLKLVGVKPYTFKSIYLWEGYCGTAQASLMFSLVSTGYRSMGNGLQPEQPHEPLCNLTPAVFGQGF